MTSGQRPNLSEPPGKVVERILGGNTGTVVASSRYSVSDDAGGLWNSLVSSTFMAPVAVGLSWSRDPKGGRRDRQELAWH